MGNISGFLSQTKKVILSSGVEGVTLPEEKTCLFQQAVPDVLLRIHTCVVERLTLCAEMYSVCVLVFAAMQSYVVDIKSNLQRKRRRKKNKSSQETESVPFIIEDYHSSMKCFIDLGEDILKAVEEMKSEACSIPYMSQHQTKPSTLTEEISKLDINSDEEVKKDCATDVLDFSPILDVVSQSYEFSAKQLLFILDRRLQNLKDIKL